MCVSRVSKTTQDKCNLMFQPLMLSEIMAQNYYRMHQTQQNQHDTVQHIYQDHAKDPIDPVHAKQSTRGGTNQNGTTFPQKLFYMLQVLQQEGLNHIASWQPHGRCFLVHNATEFAEQLPRFFKVSKFASFQRQLNLYGFIRLSRGMDKGGYYNQYFLRGRSDLLKNIVRVSVKGNEVRGRSNPKDEPDFWNSMEWVGTTDSCSIICKVEGEQSKSVLEQDLEGFLWGRSFYTIDNETSNLCRVLELEKLGE